MTSSSGSEVVGKVTGKRKIAVPSVLKMQKEDETEQIVSDISDLSLEDNIETNRVKANVKDDVSNDSDDNDDELLLLDDQLDEKDDQDENKADTDQID